MSKNTPQTRGNRNSGFQCKQFFIAHDQCAMKVGTDSLMLGSWSDVSKANTVLDIGTGSGILALMLAQRAKPTAHITGLDIDENAFLQAKDNGEKSPWASRLSFINVDIEYHEEPKRYDCIITNPPYFELTPESTHAMSSSRRKAREEFTLTYQNLLCAVKRLLCANGVFYLILPEVSVERFNVLASEAGLTCRKSLRVRSRVNTPFIRRLMVYEFNHSSAKSIQETLTIYRNDGGYTETYKALCNPYYLNF